MQMASVEENAQEVTLEFSVCDDSLLWDLGVAPRRCHAIVVCSLLLSSPIMLTSTWRPVASC